MIKKFILVLFAGFLTTSEVSAQSDWYVTSGGETIFSFPFFSNPTQDATVVRFAPVLNIQSMVNKDMSSSFGVYSGIAVRNVGFIADDPSDPNVRMKFRTYNVGVPIGIKVGNLSGKFVYAGADFELPFNFKEKRFEGGNKTSKQVYWFSNRVTQFQTAILFGFQFYGGMNLKFKYYLSPFFDSSHPDYSSNYQRFDANVFYISLNSNLFKGTRFTYSQ